MESPASPDRLRCGYFLLSTFYFSSLVHGLKLLIDHFAVARGASYLLSVRNVEFEWDAKKETFNLAKYGVSFVEAQKAFFDPRRVIATDESHSKKEPRLFCIGRSERGIVTVCFTERGRRFRIIGAEYWRKGKELDEKTNR